MSTTDTINKLNTKEKEPFVCFLTVPEEESEHNVSTVKINQLNKMESETG